MLSNRILELVLVLGCSFNIIAAFAQTSETSADNITVANAPAGGMN